MSWARLAVAGGERFDVLDEGSGKPVVFIQTALVADELCPMASRLRDRFRTIVYHRRGYGSSRPATSPGSITRDAADCCALLESLELSRVHIVGLSYSAAVAMQLAVEAPETVHTMTLVEPPPVHVPSGVEFRAVNETLLAIRRADGLEAALEEFMAMVVGRRWRTDMEGHLAGSAEQIGRDAGTFFDIDLPALLAWRFSADDANRIECPVLHIGGTASGPWFAEVRTLVMAWMSDVEDVRVEGADHSLALTHADEVAAALIPFLERHALPSSGEPSR